MSLLNLASTICQSFHCNTKDTIKFLTRIGMRTRPVNPALQSSFFLNWNLYHTWSCVWVLQKIHSRDRLYASEASYICDKLSCHPSSISVLPVLRKRLEHHLFLSAFPCISSPLTSRFPISQTNQMSPHHANISQVRHILPPNKSFPVERLRLVEIPIKTVDCYTC